jgi:hypothetical protein
MKSMKRLTLSLALFLSLLLPAPALPAVTSFGGYTFYGLSSDTKPATVEGARFWESDTKKWYLRQSGSWVDWTPEGVTGGNAHDHNGGDGAQIAYSSLSGLATLPTTTTCSGTDKVSAYSATTGAFTCTTDQGGSGAFSITQIEIDMGWPAVRDKLFTITDAGVSAGMKIIATLAYEDNSTAANSADEALVSEIHCAAGKADTGTYSLFCSAPLPVGGKLKVNITKAS